MKPKYSVIVPIYNAEKTLARCVDSLLSQNYALAQIILVNDGSKDSSGEICRAYAKEYDRVVFVEKENEGVSSARNLGLKLAEGEYITFVDSDDFVCPGYFAKLDKTLADHPADLIIFSHVTTNGETMKTNIRQPYASQSEDEYFCRLGIEIYKKGINAPWGKVYRADIITEKKIRFPKGISIAEDRLFNIAYALACKSIYISENVLYTLSVENENSLSRAVREDLDQQFQLYDQELKQIIESAELEEPHMRCVQEALNFSKIRSVYSEAKRLHQRGVSMSERRQYILDSCNKLNKERLAIPNSRFCRLLNIPVRWRLTTIIDLMAKRLAK